MTKSILIFLCLIILGGFFRLIGLNWDQGNHLHPDERFLTQVAIDISWPGSIYRYLDTNLSPANPHNRNHTFYVYGTFPVYIVKFVADVFSSDNYDKLTLIGRVVSAVFDLGTLVLVFIITRRLYRHSAPALVAGFIYAISVLPIQLSHFFAVDTFLVFFLTLTFYFLLLFISEAKLYKYFFLSGLMGITFGLSLSSKITAVLFLPIIGLGFLLNLIKSRRIIPVLLSGLIYISLTYFAVRFAQPYLFADSRLISFSFNPKLLANWQQLRSFDDPGGFYPPAVQWITTQPFIFPFLNLIYWGLGLPLAITALISLAYVSFKTFISRRIELLLPIIWIIFLFTYQGLQFAKPMRYFYPIYPFLAVISGIFIFDMFNRFRHRRLIYSFFVVLVSIYPLSFISIYLQPHTRIAATAWISQHIPAGSTLSCEYWDDCLPLGGTGSYTTVEYHLYDPDSAEKLTALVSQLRQTDYIILSSNRLYGSIMTVPQKYPLTAKFYAALFSGQLGFSQVAEFTSRPHLPLPGLSLCLTPPFQSYGSISQSSACPHLGINFVDDYADETFTVYDHPKVTIFQKHAPVDYSAILSAPKI